MNSPQINRALKIIQQVIGKLNLNLQGKTVLTEVGSGLFIYTPIIALMAGAEKVFAWTKDTPYGNADDIIETCKSILKIVSISDDKIVFSKNERPVEHIQQANIITNSGHIRPLDKSFLEHVNPANTVIPLMYEKWELRHSDIDIDYCLANHIKVAGTWENHPDLKIFDYCEQLILKICFEAGYEIAQNKIIIWSDDHFGALAERGFKSLGASNVIKTTDLNVLYENVSQADFIFFCDYLSKRNLIGIAAEIDLDRIIKINNSIGIVHLSGSIDNDDVKKKNISIYPDQKGYPVRMTFTLAHLGLTPVLHLQAAGLKVGELLYKNIPSELVQIIN